MARQVDNKHLYYSIAKQSCLSADVARDLLSYDEETGELRWKKTGKRAGCAPKGSGYRTIGIQNIRYTESRVIWLIVHGNWPELFLDHINGDKTDNRIANLRLADASQNAQNRKPSLKAKSGFRNVHWTARENVWRSIFYINGKCYSKRFKDREIASLWVYEMKSLLSPEFSSHEEAA